jgi:hypothetical protein
MMTMGVEFDYRDAIPNAKMGVEILVQSSPETMRYFDSQPAEIRGRRSFALFPVKFQPPPEAAIDTLSTDQVLVFLEDGLTGQRFNLAKFTVLCAWRAPSAPKDSGAQ